MNDSINESARQSIRTNILNSAKEIVTQDRNIQYGSPENSFNTISKLWRAYTGFPISPSDVAIMLALLKVARLKNNPKHEDSWIDLAGYAACGAEAALTETN